MKVQGLLAALLITAASIVQAQGAGTFDSNFGVRGRVLQEYFGPAQKDAPLVDVTAQDSQRRLLLGGTPRAQGTFQSDTATLLRLTPSGAIDTSFGSDGFIEMQPVAPFEGGETQMVAVATTTLDRVLVLFEYHASDALNGQRSRLCRFSASGELDPGFGIGGCSFVQFNPEAGVEHTSDMAVEADGDIIVLGDTESIPPGERPTTVSRFHADGSLDLCFNDPTCSFGGTAFLDVPGSDFSLQLVLAPAPDGRIVVGFLASLKNEVVSDWWVARLLPTGAIDLAFNVDGYARVGVNNDAVYNYPVTDIIVRSNGRIVVAGETEGPINGNQLTLAQFTTTGTLDPSFSGDGRLDTFISDVNVSESDAHLALQDDGKLVLAGSSLVIDSRFRAGVVRLLPNGEADDTFGFDGRRYIGYRENSDANAQDSVRGVHVDGRGITVAGSDYHVGEQKRRYAALRVGQDDLFRDGYETPSP